MLPLLVIVLYAASLFGWGRLVATWALPQAPVYPALTAALGLLALALIGGVLNAVHGASAPALDILVVAGWLLCAVFGWRARQRLRDMLKKLDWRDLPLAILIVAVFVFFALTLLPGRSFNVFDDFLSYLVAPVRMLQMGTLAGNPFDGSGAAALGVQAFFQAIGLAHFPVAYAAGFDAVLCLGLAAAAVSELARHMGANRFVQILAVLVFLAINPGTVNLTSVFSASLVVLALVFVTIEALRTGMTARLALLLGVCTAVLIGFKSTYLVVALLYWALVLALGLIHRQPIFSLRLFAVALGGAALFAVPWIAVYAPEMIQFIPILADRPVPIPPFQQAPDDVPLTLRALLTFRPAFYGATYGAYGIVCAVLGVGAAVLLWKAHAGRAKKHAATAIPVTALAVGALLFLPILALLSELNTALRFAAPILAAAVALLTARLTSLRRTNEADLRPEDFTNSGYIARTAIFVVPLLIIAVFAPSFIDRLDGALDRRSQISFGTARQPTYLSFVDAVLTPSYGEWITKVQDTMPPDTTILAWHSAPLLMDFRRNRVFTFNEQGYVNPFFRFPSEGSLQDVTDGLKRAGVRYIMWEHAGFSVFTEKDYLKRAYSPFSLVRTQNFLMLRMQSYMNKVRSSVKPLYLDGRMAVFDVETIAF